MEITGYGYPYDTGGDHSYDSGYGYPYNGDHSYDSGYGYPYNGYHHHHHHHPHHTYYCKSDYNGRVVEMFPFECLSWRMRTTLQIKERHSTALYTLYSYTTK
jgi:hypothetical protein